MTKPYLPTIAVDFDGVIHSYKSGWHGATSIPDPPVPGAIEFLVALTQSSEVDVVIFSSRAKTWRGRRAIGAWLQKHGGHLWHEDAFDPGLQSIEVTAVKPAAVVYLDDRGLRFEGTFPDIKELLALTPWNKQ